MLIGMALAAFCVFPLNPPLVLFTVTLASAVATASLEQVIVYPAFTLHYQGSLLIGFAALLAMSVVLAAAAKLKRVSSRKLP